MTSKLKCPFCGKKLWYDEQDGIYRCMKFGCVMDYEGGTEKLWHALIHAKQDLEIARKALEEIDTTRCIPQQTLISLGKRSKTTRFNAGNIICVATPDYIHNTLEQIRHKE